MKRFFFLACMAVVFFFPVQADAYSMTVEEKYPQLIETQTFSGLVSDRIEQALAESGETRRHTIDVVRVPRSMHVPDGDISYDVSLPNGLRNGSMMAVNIAISLDGVPFRQIVCSARIHLYDSVVVAARGMAPEKTIQAADVRIEERELDGSRNKNFTNLQDVVGRVPNRLIREGTLLTAAMLRNPIIFDAGTQVYIMANINGINVRTEGVALQSGREGSVIRVRNASSGRVLRARVMDATTVEVLQSDAG